MIGNVTKWGFFLLVESSPVVQYHFNFNTILILPLHTGHCNFGFNQCSVFTECCFLSLKKVWMINSSYSHHLIKNPQHPSPLYWGVGILPPLNAIWKTLIVIIFTVLERNEKLKICTVYYFKMYEWVIQMHPINS